MSEPTPAPETSELSTETDPKGGRGRGFRIVDYVWGVAIFAALLGAVRVVPDPLPGLIVLVMLSVIPAIACGVAESAWSRASKKPNADRFGPRRLAELWATFAIFVVAMAGMSILAWGLGPFGTIASAVSAAFFAAIGGRASKRLLDEFANPTPREPVGLKRVAEFSVMGVVVIAGVVMVCIIGVMALFVAFAMLHMLGKLLA